MNRRRPVAAALLLLGLAASAGPLRAQEIHGRTVDGAGRPLAGVPVTLHRVGPSGGSAIGQAVSGDDGRFTFPPPAAADDGVLFALAERDGELYVGAPFRPPLPEGAEYTLLVDASTALGAALGPAAPPGASRSIDMVARPSEPAGGTSRSAAFLLLLVAAGALALGLWLHSRRAPLRRRRLLAALAELEESLASGEGEVPELEARRAELRRRLGAGPAPA